jgi:FdhD protein
MNLLSETTIIQYKNGSSSQKQDSVVKEMNIRMTIQCEPAGSFTCSPSHLEDLATGYLLTSGLISETNQLVHLEYIEEKQKFDVTLEDNSIVKDKKFQILQPLGCARGDQIYIKSNRTKAKGLPYEVLPSQILTLMKEFGAMSGLYEKTGGAHSAAIAIASKILVFREDIGRHNAVDKAIGAIHRTGDSFSDKIILTSGRISSEIMLKAINSGVGMIISGSAPTLKAIELAKEYEVALIGFARGARFNVYSCSHSVKLHEHKT